MVCGTWLSGFEGSLLACDIMASAHSHSSKQQQQGDWNAALTEDFLDATTFEQLLEMDDDDEREFSKGIVWNYFDQVKNSFAQIEKGM
jgi:osomolarity two-component system, phosphorelay intermediate protein YPD1